MKFVIIADYHIGDFVRYNISPRYRLNEKKKLADHIVELVKGKVDGVILAGDQLDKPTNRPYILETFSYCMNKLREIGEVYYILGQHDMDSKSSNHSHQDSAVTAFYRDRGFHYMDKKILTIGDYRISFMDHYKVQDLSWITTPVDVHIGHISIGYGQDYDRTKFRKCFFGDIHKEFTDGNCISIGNLLPCKVTDQQSGSLIILDTETDSYERIAIDPDHERYLRLMYSTPEEPSGYNKKLTWYIPKGVKKVAKSIKTAVTLEDIDMENAFESSIESEGLSELHKEMIQRSDSYTPTDFNFKLTSIRILNIKGISELEYNFGGDLMVIGGNGSGKSSFILAIFYGLDFTKSLANVRRRIPIEKGKFKVTTRSEIEINLLYQGSEFRLIRSTDGDSIYINGIEQKYNRKSDVAPDVIKKLPFLKYLSSYFFNNWDGDLFSSLGVQRKMKMISMFNGLDVYDHYLQLSLGLLSYAVNKLKQVRKDHSSQAKIVESYESSILKSEARVKSFRLPEVIKIDLNSSEFLGSNLTRLKDLTTLIESATSKVELDEMRSELVELEAKYTEIAPLLSELDSIKSEGQRIAESLNSAKSDKLSWERDKKVCSVCNSTINEKTWNSIYQDRLGRIETLRIQFQNLKDRRSEVLEKVGDFNLDRLKSLRIRVAEAEAQHESLGALIQESEDLSTYCSSFSEDEKSKVADRILELKAELEESIIQVELLRSLTEKKEDYKIAKAELESLTEEKLKLKDRIEKLEKYSNILSKSSPIYLSVLEKIANSISNENFFFYLKDTDEGKDLTCDYLTENGWMNYKHLSSGQKALVDAYYLSKLINKGGIVVMDEYFRFVEEANLHVISDILPDMDCNQLIISTNSENLLLPFNTLNFNEINRIKQDQH